MTGCPSELRLEQHLLDPEVSPLAGHVLACADCRDRLAEMERIGAEFRAQVYPATVDRVAGAARTRQVLRWIVALVPAPALAAAAVFLLLQPAPRPPDDYVGVKGADLRLAVFAREQGGARALADGQAVPAAAALRFQLRSPAPCRLWLVSVDGAGQVSRLFPAKGDESAAVEGGGPLPGGAVLDGRAGPERIYAVCTRGPLPFADVERAARAAAAGGPRAVRAGAVLRGLPEGAWQATLLLEKGS